MNCTVQNSMDNVYEINLLEQKDTTAFDILSKQCLLNQNEKVTI